MLLPMCPTSHEKKFCRCGLDLLYCLVVPLGETQLGNDYEIPFGCFER